MSTVIVAVLIFLLAPFSQGRPQVAEKSAIEGVVTRAGTGEPLSRAQITLSHVSPRQGNTETPSTITDGQGKFAFRELEAGSYRIAVVRNGYVRQEFGQRAFGGRGAVVTLVPGQVVKDLAIPLTPAGNVSGVIRDHSGEPVAGFQVQLLRLVYNASGQRSLQVAGASQTNDRGEYRVYWVTPGLYFLSAGNVLSGPIAALMPRPNSPNEFVDRTLPTTYYPGTIDISRAVTLEVMAGAELAGIDMVMPQQPLFRIRGRVIDSSSGRHPRAASVTLTPRGPSPPASFLSSIEAIPPYNPTTGEFELRDVAPGSYWVRVTVLSTQGASANVADNSSPEALTDAFSGLRQSAQVAVDVLGADVEGVTLAPISGVEIKGRLSVQGQALTTVPGYERLRVQLRPANSVTVANPSPNHSMGPDGTFTLENVLPGEYWVGVTGLPRDYYLRDAHIDQTDALSLPLSITGQGAGLLTVVLSPGAARISGIVRNARLEPMPDIQIIIIPDRGRGRPDLYKTASTDQAGRFTLQDIRPGDYKIFSWEALEPFAYFDEDVIRRFEPRGKALHIGEASSSSVEVRSISDSNP